MKLIQPPQTTIERIEVKKYSTRSLLRDFVTLGAFPPTDKDVVEQYDVPGRINTTNTIIDFEVQTNPESILGTKIDVVLIGDKTLFGVCAIQHIEGNTYECAVDMME